MGHSDYAIWPDGAPGSNRLSHVLLQLLRAAGLNPAILSPAERTELVQILAARLPSIPNLPISAELLHNPAKLEEALMMMFDKNEFNIMGQLKADAEKDAKRAEKEAHDKAEEARKLEAALKQQDDFDFWLTTNDREKIEEAVRKAVVEVASMACAAVGAKTLEEPDIKGIADKLFSEQAKVAVDRAAAEQARQAEHQVGSEAPIS